MEAVTVARLRGLARLVLDGVDGASSALEAAVAGRIEVVASWTHVPADRLTNARGRELAALVLARAPRRTATDQVVRECVLDLERRAEHEDGRVKVPVEALARLVSVTPSVGLWLGMHGGISTRYLRHVLRALRTTDVTDVVVGRERLTFVYRGHACRGVLALCLSEGRAVPGDVVVSFAPTHEAPAISTDEPAAEPRDPYGPRERPPPRPFLWSALEVVARALAQEWP